MCRRRARGVALSPSRGDRAAARDPSAEDVRGGGADERIDQTRVHSHVAAFVRDTPVGVWCASAHDSGGTRASTSRDDRRVHAYHADGHECAACHADYADGHRVAAGRVTGRGHVTPCDTCGVEHDVYHSCRNRRGPSCHGVSRREYARVARRARDRAAAGALTLPAELRALVRSHQRVLLGALMQTAAESWQALAADPH